MTSLRELLSHSKPVLIVVAGVLIGALPAPSQPPPGASHPCKMSVAQGFVEFRRAQFQPAMEHFQDALAGTETCIVEARLGMAITFNGLNDHKKAVAEARWVLQATDDPELLGEAHYQVGRGLHKRGSRMTQQKQEAEAAFLQAVDVTAGKHRAAVRALSRIYQETRRDEDLTALQKRFPDLRLRSRDDRPRVGPAPSKNAASLDCGVQTEAEWNQDVPKFWGEDGAQTEGYTAPERTLTPVPRYPKKARREQISGAVPYQALIDTHGVVVKVKILESLHPDLDLSVLEAVCKQAYVPASNPAGETSVAFIRDAHTFELETPKAKHPD